MIPNICKHYREVDSDYHGSYEFCYGRWRRCGCSGVKEQCNYPEYFEIEKENLRCQTLKNPINK